MKTIFSLFLLLTLSFSVLAQKTNPDLDLYKSKVESYTKMKNTGKTLGIVGGGLTVIGVALVSSAEWETTTDEYGFETTTADGSGVAGILSLCVGVPVAVTGIILNSIGNKKVAEYSKKLENVNVSYFKQGKQTGLTLAIRF